MKVTSASGRAARDHLIDDAVQKGWGVQVRGAMPGEPGTYVRHVQFRTGPTQRPYPLSLTLNPEVPKLYVRRPGPTFRTFWAPSTAQPISKAK